jgi:hypothetical protein
MLKNPVKLNQQRSGAGVGITATVYPVPQELKPASSLELLKRNLIREALVFTRHEATARTA